jgi:hypothetical protein
MNTKLILDNYLGKNTKTTEKDMGDGTKQVCELITLLIRTKKFK